jgi:hypothetical protein
MDAHAHADDPCRRGKEPPRPARAPGNGLGGDMDGREDPEKPDEPCDPNAGSEPAGDRLRAGRFIDRGRA